MQYLKDWENRTVLTTNLNTGHTAEGVYITIMSTEISSAGCATRIGETRPFLLLYLMRLVRNVVGYRKQVIERVA